MIPERPELALDIAPERLDVPFGTWRTVRADEARTNCVRCGADVHPSDPPHLCKDVQGRLNAWRNNRRQHLRALLRGRR